MTKRSEKARIIKGNAQEICWADEKCFLFGNLKVEGMVSHR